MSFRTSFSVTVVVLGLLMNGCGKDEDKNAQQKNGDASSSLKEFVPKLDGGENGEAIANAESSAADATVSEDTLIKAGQILDQSIIAMQALALSFANIKDEAGAKEAAPRITEKVAALVAINEESRALGISEAQGQKHFPEKYQQLKQMSLLMQGHMQRMALDLPTYTIVQEAWKKGQAGGAQSSPHSDSGTGGSSAAASTEGAAAEATPQSAAPEEPKRKRLREYDRSQFATGSMSLGAAHSMSMPYDQCLTYAQQTIAQMGVDPSKVKTIVQTEDTSMTQVCMPDGNLVITCSKKDGQLNMTKAPPQSSVGC